MKNLRVIIGVICLCFSYFEFTGKNSAYAAVHLTQNLNQKRPQSKLSQTKSKKKKKSKLKKTSSFARAESYIKNGQFKRAKSFLKKQLRKQPKNKRLNLLLGGVYSIEQKHKLAVKYFRKSGKSVKKSRYGFYYGISFYAVKKCQQAVYGFKQVRKRNSEIFSDSQFYMGVCYYNQGRFTLANRSFRRAKGGSAELEPSRRTLMVQSSRRQNRSIQSLQGRSNNNIVLARPVVPQSITDQPGSSENPIKAPKKVVEAPPLTWGVTPSIKGTYLFSENQNHGFITKESATTQIDGQVAGKVSYLLPKKSGGQPTLQGSLVGVHGTKNQSGNTLTNFGTLDQLEVQEDLSESEGSKGAISGSVSVDYPFTSAITIKAGGGFKRHLGDLSGIPFFPSQKKVGEFDAKLGLNLSVENVVVLSNFVYRLLQSEEETVGNQLIFDASIIKNWEAFSFEAYSQMSKNAVALPEEKVVGPNLTINSYVQLGWTLFKINFSAKGQYKLQIPGPDEKINSSYGAANILEVQLSLNKELFKGFNGQLKAGFSQFSDYHVPAAEDGSSNEIDATATKYNFGAGLTVNPLPFFSLGAEYSLANYTWLVANEADQKAFEQVTGNIETNYKVYAGLSYSF